MCLECHVTCLSPMTMQWPADGISLRSIGRMSNVQMWVWTSQEGLLAGALCEWGLLVSPPINPLKPVQWIFEFLIYSSKKATLMANNGFIAANIRYDLWTMNRLEWWSIYALTQMLSASCYQLPVISFLLSAPCYQLPVISFLLSASWYQLPVISFLLSASWYQLPVISSLLSAPCYQLPVISFLLSASCDQLLVISSLLSASCYQLPVISFLLSASWYQLPVISFLLSASCYQLPVISSLLSASCYELPLQHWAGPRLDCDHLSVCPSVWPSIPPDRQVKSSQVKNIFIAI